MVYVSPLQLIHTVRITPPHPAADQLPDFLIDTPTFGSLPDTVYSSLDPAHPFSVIPSTWAWDGSASRQVAYNRYVRETEQTQQVTEQIPLTDPCTLARAFVRCCLQAIRMLVNATVVGAASFVYLQGDNPRSFVTVASSGVPALTLVGASRADGSGGDVASDNIWATFFIRRTLAGNFTEDWVRLFDYNVSATYDLYFEDTSAVYAWSDVGVGHKTEECADPVRTGPGGWTGRWTEHPRTRRLMRQRALQLGRPPTRRRTLRRVRPLSRQRTLRRVLRRTGPPTRRRTLRRVRPLTHRPICPRMFRQPRQRVLRPPRRRTCPLTCRPLRRRTRQQPRPLPAQQPRPRMPQLKRQRVLQLPLHRMHRPPLRRPLRRFHARAGSHPRRP